MQSQTVFPNHPALSFSIPTIKGVFSEKWPWDKGGKAKGEVTAGLALGMLPELLTPLPSKAMLPNCSGN